MIVTQSLQVNKIIGGVFRKKCNTQNLIKLPRLYLLTKFTNNWFSHEDYYCRRQ